MKQNFLIILAVVTLGFSSCKKSSGPKPSTSSPDTYLPVSSGSHWTYKDVVNGTTFTSTITITGATTVFNGKTYYNISGTSTKNGPSTGYFYTGNHSYVERAPLAAASTTVELQLGNDSQPAGYSWTTTPTDDGYINGVAAQTINTIMEKDITKTVNGKTFNNVIHTQLDLQYDFGAGFESIAVYDVYLAKGVGMIQIETSTSGTLYESETLTNYTIK
ncbi:MAG: hypothetical protein ACXVB0_25075 [Mucilaginibacter sp.]